jgi:hypothetical protein
MNPWLTIASVVAPEVINLVKAIAALRKKYPALTADQINAAIVSVTSQADTAFDDVLQKIAADQAAHPNV